MNKNAKVEVSAPPIPVNQPSKEQNNNERMIEERILKIMREAEAQRKVEE